MDVLVISILDCGLRFTMYMYIKSSHCTIEIYTIIFVNYLSVKLGKKKIHVPILKNKKGLDRSEETWVLEQSYDFFVWWHGWIHPQSLRVLILKGRNKAPLGHSEITSGERLHPEEPRLLHLWLGSEKRAHFNHFPTQGLKQSLCTAGKFFTVWAMREAPKEKTSILAQKIPWTEEPGRLQATEVQRVGHDWATNARLQERDRSPLRTLMQRPSTTYLQTESSNI